MATSQSSKSQHTGRSRHSIMAEVPIIGNTPHQAGTTLTQLSPRDLERSGLWAAEELPEKLQQLLTTEMGCDLDQVNIFRIQNLTTIVAIVKLGLLTQQALIAEFPRTQMTDTVFVGCLVKIITLAQHFDSLANATLKRQTPMLSTPVGAEAISMFPDNKESTNAYCEALDVSVLKRTSRLLNRTVVKDLQEAIVEPVSYTHLTLPTN